mmetsp:Transcript_11626/g.43686  ORF Transcript_11626/g.43686 Transcript_11626/m.43686 type:complete len:80 (-) Transcript_11626:2475-2714(-)
MFVEAALFGRSFFGETFFPSVPELLLGSPFQVTRAKDRHRHHHSMLSYARVYSFVQSLKTVALRAMDANRNAQYKNPAS